MKRVQLNMLRLINDFVIDNDLHAILIKQVIKGKRSLEDIFEEVQEIISDQEEKGLIA